MPIDEGLALLAHYPFLPEAREHVRREGYSVGDLLTDAAFERVRRRSVQRVRASLDREPAGGTAIAGEADAEIELLSYPVARLVLAHFGDAYLNGRYAVAESKLLNDRLSREDSPDTIWKVVQGLGVPLEPAIQEDVFARVHFLDFLRFAPARDPEWKLVNQPLRGGFVDLTKERAVRLAESALKDKLLEELEELERPGREVLRAMEKDLTELQTRLMEHRARFQTDAVGEVRVDAFPPCMKAIWAGIQNHQNIPHMGRFAIVSFLHKLGMDSEAILRFFSAVPDFDVNKSRYQIEHITGKIGGSTEYTPPNCSTMQTYGVCPLEARDDLCLHVIHHPLSYYRKRLRSLPAPKPPATPAASQPPEAKHAG